MNLNQNQQLFEEFQRSVDQAHTLAMKLGPEHFYLAYDRCAKLQKVIFKRACGYCSTNDVTSECKDFQAQQQMKPAPFNMCYLNLPTLSLCCPPVPIVQSNKTNTESSNPQKEIIIDNVFLLRQHNNGPPSILEINELEKEGCVMHHCSIQLSQTVQDVTKCLLHNFLNTNNLQYELCISQTDVPNILKPLQNSEMLSEDCFTSNSTLYIRPIQAKVELKTESSLSPLSFANSDGSINSGRINSFIMDAEIATVPNGILSESSGIVFPEPRFSSMDVDSYSPKSTATKPHRRYNWSVILTKLHEKMPVTLNHEVLPSPNKCHELHVIPPTTQKLRPTKRCQLCLKGYKSRKESRYYCMACDKGFHIKCFEVYHSQVGCIDFKVKIIGSDH